MPSIGLITAASKNSVALYQSYLEEAIVKKPPQNHPKIQSVPIDFELINQYLPYDMLAAAEALKSALKAMPLEAITSLILPNFTLHEALDLINDDEAFKKKLFHLKAGLPKDFQSDKKLLLVGSAYTMRHHYISSLIGKEAEVLTCSPQIIQQLEQQRAVFYAKADEALAINTFKTLEAAYPSVEQFVLCCTEHVVAFELVKNKIDTSRYLNLAQKHCVALVEKNLKV